MEDFASLEKLIELLPEGSPQLPPLAAKFQSVGLCDAAVSAYLRAGGDANIKVWGPGFGV